MDSPGKNMEYSIIVGTQNGACRVRMQLGKKVILSTPNEGLWSVAIGWEDDWPSNWMHAHPESVKFIDPWIITEGVLQMPDGELKLRDAYLPMEHYVKCIRRFTWNGKKALSPCTLSVRWQAGKPGAKEVLPGILYFGNPSGAQSERVPVYTGKPGERAIYEEHRFPMPFASLEWENKESLYGGALHSLPSPLACGNLTDQWWSLGVIGNEDTSEMAILSGPCASNGNSSVVKGTQRGFLKYPDAYLTIQPGGIIEKTFFLEVYPVSRRGLGFRTPLQNSIHIFQPLACEDMPTFHEILHSKYNLASSRFHEGEKSVGFRKYPDKNVYVMGWCGQAAAPGYAFMVLADRLGKPEAREMAQKSLDHLCKAPFNDDGFMVQYDPDNDVWDSQNPLSQGQGMENFARAILYGKQKPSVNTKDWASFLQKACDVHSKRILENDWRPKSTNEGFLVSPLCKAFQLFQKEVYKEAAIKAAEHYADRHLEMGEPYWGGTLDARCEDKEGAWAAFQAFLAVYEMTQDEKYLHWAEHALDVMLTYTVVWDIQMPPGRLADHGFKSRGWTAVSVQNMHLDAYGVMATPAIYRMGQILDNDDLKQMALLMFRSCGQLIDPYGSQGEQIQQTNYAQHGQYSEITGMRGGYVEGWTVFWITAHFLNAAAQFEEMNAPIWD